MGVPGEEEMSGWELDGGIEKWVCCIKRLGSGTWPT